VPSGEEHAGELLLHFAGAILIGTGPFGCEHVAATDEGADGEMDLCLTPGCSRPVIVNRFSSDNGRAERILPVFGVAGEETCGKVGVVRFPGFFVFDEEVRRVACA
jgi:hypothetical protein